MRILFVSSEVAPFSKTGGLGDVSSALPGCLQGMGHEVMVVTPLYAGVRQGGHLLHQVYEPINVPAAAGSEFSAHLAEDGRTWFVDYPPLYDRSTVYTNDHDEHRRFLFLTHASLELCRRRGWSPEIVHCNDWQTGMTPLYLKSLYASDPLFADSRSVFTIHNLAYQGVFSSQILPDLSLGLQQYLLQQEHLHQGWISFIEHALIYADAITTVSPTYAWEIQTPEFGAGLDELLRLRAHDLHGILNGIDTTVWNPRTDPNLRAKYTERTLDDKAINKQYLLSLSGLDVAMDRPLLGMVSRLTGQKGIELMIRPLTRLLDEDRIRFIALGLGEPKYEEALGWVASTFPDRASYHRGYDEPLSHLIEGGSDAFLMPSRYEPSGLNQMYSLAYGTPPVVRRTGGLADTVTHYDPVTGEGTGFVFDHYTEEGFVWALQQLLGVFPNRDAWRRLQLNGMAEDNSWERRGAEYDDLYRRVTGETEP